MQIRARDSQRTVLDAQVQRNRAHLAALRDQQRILGKQIGIAEELLNMRQTLLAKGLVSKVKFLETERALAQARSELALTMGRIAEGEATLGEAESRLLELDASLRNAALDQMGEVTAELTRTREAITRAEDRVSRLAIHAPIRGIIKGLQIRTLGAVLPAGAPLMDVVPIDDTLLAEIRINPADIGHVRIDQPARVRFTTFDVARFGTAPGRLTHLSASTFQDEQGEPYYRGLVALAKQSIGEGQNRKEILPGMTVEADIVTDRRSLLEYLMKPMMRGLERAFHER